MKLKLKRDLLIDGVDHQPGDEVDVPTHRAMRNIAAGDGVALEPPVPNAPGAPRAVSLVEIPPPELTGEVNVRPIAEGEVVRKEGCDQVRYVTKLSGRTIEVPADGRITP